MRPLKTKKLQVRESDVFLDRLARASVVTDRPVAQIVRDAIREHLDKLTAQFPEIDKPQRPKRQAQTVTA